MIFGSQSILISAIIEKEHKICIYKNITLNMSQKFDWFCI